MDSIMPENTDRNAISVSKISTTPIGKIWLATSSCGLKAIKVGGNRDDFLRTFSPEIKVVFGDCNEGIQNAVTQITEYFEGTRKEFKIPIDWRGFSDFHKLALKAVYAIPYAETRSYSQIAAQIGKPGAARAVGRANATNPIPLVIPCHRVIGSDGGLRGYGAGEGLKTKAWLLDMEKHFKLDL
jgi:methylated-DNA-[protein]-cysteine S-methyltransferase